MHDPDGDGLLSAVLDATTDGVAVVDAGGEVAVANEALRDLVGGTVEGRAWSSLFGDAPAPDALAAAAAPVETTLATDRDDGARDDDSTTALLAAHGGTPVAVSGRRVDGRVVATVSDRTDAVERDTFERILESVDDGIYMLDADGRVQYVNEAAIDAHDLEYDRADILGAFATRVLPAEDIEACIEAIRALIESADEDSERVEVTVEDADGSEIPAELNLSLLPPVDGEFAGSVGVLRDVSERRRRDQMLRVLNRVLRHNLRNDMNVVVGTTDIIDASDGDVDPEHTARIRRVAESLVELGGKAHVVEELTGTGTTAPRRDDVVPVVEHAVDAVDADIAVSTPPSATASVPPMFEVAVENVLENAVEYADDGTVGVRVAADDDAVAVTVADEGPGIPEAELAALESETETPLEHASGLGLWLTDWIVGVADGRVAYDVDDGTTVTLELPAAE